MRALPEPGTRARPDRARLALADRRLHASETRLRLAGQLNEQESTPLSPLENIALAVSRQPPDGTPPDEWHPEQRLTVAKAFAAHTANPAFASYEEDRKGTIREGNLAVVLSRDILGLDADAIRATHVDLMILDGSVIYRRKP